MATPNTNRVFLPYVRRGLAAAITVPDTRRPTRQSSSFTAQVNVSSPGGAPLPRSGDAPPRRAGRHRRARPPRRRADHAAGQRQRRRVRALRRHRVRSGRSSLALHAGGSDVEWPASPLVHAARLSQRQRGDGARPGDADAEAGAGDRPEVGASAAPARVGLGARPASRRGGDRGDRLEPFGRAGDGLRAAAGAVRGAASLPAGPDAADQLHGAPGSDLRAGAAGRPGAGPEMAPTRNSPPTRLPGPGPTRTPRRSCPSVTSGNSRPAW